MKELGEGRKNPLPRSHSRQYGKAGTSIGMTSAQAMTTTAGLVIPAPSTRAVRAPAQPRPVIPVSYFHSTGFGATAHQQVLHLPLPTSITVVVTPAAHTVPLADGISEADYERERGDANEPFHFKTTHRNRALFPIGPPRFLRNHISTRFQKRTRAVVLRSRNGAWQVACCQPP